MDLKSAMSALISDIYIFIKNKNLYLVKQINLSPI